MDQFIKNTICEFVTDYRNSADSGWKKPLVAHASADDLLFDNLKVEGLNKHKCYEMCLVNAGRSSDLESIADVCGKCLVSVPCSTIAPAG